MPRNAGRSLAVRASTSERVEASYSKYTVRELKSLLRERLLSESGRKQELVDRLIASDTSAGAKATGDDAEGTSDGSNSDDNSQGGKDDDAETQEEEEEEEAPPRPPYGAALPNPHEGKPVTIIDDEGRTRYLCLDGQYRRGDPDCIECNPENFAEWLTEWVVAARTGQLEGLPRKTFLPDERRESNPTGKLDRAAKELKTKDVLIRSVDDDNKPRWKLRPGFQLGPPLKIGVEEFDE